MNHTFAYYYEREEMNTFSVSFATVHTLKAEGLKSKN